MKKYYCWKNCKNELSIKRETKKKFDLICPNCKKEYTQYKDEKAANRQIKAASTKKGGFKNEII